jgi:uracil-DNA glycosylase
MKLPDTIEDAMSAAGTTLRQLADWGCRGFDSSEQTLAILKGLGVLQSPVGAGRETLEHIVKELGECRRCGLSNTRRHILFGQGDPKAQLVFVGQGPAVEEDRSGHLLVGPAGELLARIIEAMKLSRDQIYICNVIKCHPPGDRNPDPGESAACKPFLERQLAAIAPKVICTLGSFATQALLKTQTPVTELRGRFHTCNNIKVMPTFHPAALLRNPDQKRAVWEDMKKIMVLLRIPQ